jgi:hypothetical protein
MLRVETVTHVYIHRRTRTWLQRIWDRVRRPCQPVADLPPEFHTLPAIRITVGKVNLPRTTR